MAATMKIQNYYCRILLCLVVITSGIQGSIFPLTGEPLSREEEQINHEIKLPKDIHFPFRGSIYDSVYISKDGAVGFSPSTSYRSEDYIKTLTRSDPAFVAPFFFPAQDIGSRFSNADGALYQGQTLYRVSPGSNPTDIPPAELANYSSIIQQSVIGIDQFNATFGLVVTWLEVISRQDVESGCVPATCKNSTFQLAMLTDGYRSFAIFNYVKMNTEVKMFTQAGFNAGDGRGYTPALDRQGLVDAQINYGSDVKGRYIFRIDGEQIVRGGCYNPNIRGTLNIVPNYAGMLGGKMLDISGPCMMMDSRITFIRCRFDGNDNLVTIGYKVNTMKARCFVPMMSKRGWVKVELSISSSTQYYYSTKILIVHPGRVDKEEMINLPNMGENHRWNETKTNQLTLQWNSSQLTETFNTNLNISLMGYRETKNGIIWQTLQTLGTARASDRSFTFDTSQFFGCNGAVCEDFEIGFVMASIADLTKATMHKYLVSKTIPLGFYVNKALTMQYGENWPSQKCKAWYNQDRQDMTWIQRLQHCPCNLVQALSDIGRWQPDLGCYLYDKSSTKCWYHQGAEHCVRSVQPSPDDAGVQCCYNKDGNLMYAADSFQGSTPDRSHAWGAAPYGMMNKVPSMSHWIQDVVTFYYCCLWTDYNDCDHYMDQRPTRDCSGYSPPTPAIAYGQGHIQTFDGFHHRMCADGDFILMEGNLTNGDQITVQGRFYQNVFPTIVGERGNSSVMLTNVGVKVGDQVVEIRLKLPTADRSRRKLDVLIDQQYYFFDDQQSQWQDFQKFSVVNSDKTRLGANFTVILPNGLGIQVADCQLTLCVLIMAPHELMGNVQGLLGNFNGNASDDLLTGNRTLDIPLVNGRQLSDIDRYNMLQYRWAVMDRHDSVIPILLKPTFNSSVCTISRPDRTLPECNGIQECVFDFKATGDRKIAMNTKTMSMRIQELRQFVSPARSCGPLDVPRSIKSNYNYELGQTVRVEGCRVGQLTGDDLSYTCVPTSNTTQKWSPTVTASCTAELEAADTAMIVGIVVGVLAFLVIVVVIGLVIRKARKGKSQEYGAPRNPVTDQSEEYTASYSRPHKHHKVPQEDPDKKRSSQDYSL